MKYNSWLNGRTNYIAQSCALRDGFSKGEAKGFPEYKELFVEKKSTPKTEEEKNRAVEQENNYWARR